MKVIKESRMQNGIEIYIEDWRENYPFYKTLSIAAYPVSKNTGKWGWIRGGEKFRLGLSSNFESDDQVYAIFEQLEKGEVKLEELYSHYYNGNKDKYYMGLIDCFSPEYNPEW